MEKALNWASSIEVRRWGDVSDAGMGQAVGSGRSTVGRSQAREALNGRLNLAQSPVRT